MSHIQFIKLKNFRVFNESEQINFAPITILTGKNSSGKSSVIKFFELFTNNIAAFAFKNDATIRNNRVVFLYMSTLILNSIIHYLIFIRSTLVFS